MTETLAHRNERNRESARKLLNECGFQHAAQVRAIVARVEAEEEAKRRLLISGIGLTP